MDKPLLTLIKNQPEATKTQDLLGRCVDLGLRKAADIVKRRRALNGIRDDIFFLPFSVPSEEFDLKEMSGGLEDRTSKVLDIRTQPLDIVSDGPWDLVVYISRGYTPEFIIVVTTLDDVENVIQRYPFYNGLLYFFKSDNFRADQSLEFNGKTAWQVREAVSESGNAECISDVDRIIDLMREILYGKMQKRGERVSLFVELSELRLRVGNAAVAIIADFIEDFRDRIEGMGGEYENSFLTGTDGDPMNGYDLERARFRVGRYDLRKLASS